jgi:hypothetical protein
MIILAWGAHVGQDAGRSAAAAHKNRHVEVDDSPPMRSNARWRGTHRLPLAAGHNHVALGLLDRLVGELVGRIGTLRDRLRGKSAEVIRSIVR